MNLTAADLSFTESLAREAGALLMHYQRAGFDVVHKGSVDLVTTADRESERLLVSAISARFPSHVIISEEGAGEQRASSPPHRGAPDAESGASGQDASSVQRRGAADAESGASGQDASSVQRRGAADAESGAVWYIDPLDGTTDFVHHYPNFAVSLGLFVDDEPVLGVVYDPTRDELFSAMRGGGAHLNGQPLAVSHTQRLIESLLTSGFPYDVLESGRNIETYQRLTLLTRGVRISGSSALDMAWVACGRLDGYWELELKPWDIAGGIMLVLEAGGRVTDVSGANWRPALPGVAATNGVLHALLLKEI